MVADNEDLEYRAGKTLYVKEHTQVEFKGGYIIYGRPALSYVTRKASASSLIEATMRHMVNRTRSLLNSTLMKAYPSLS